MKKLLALILVLLMLCSCGADEIEITLPRTALAETYDHITLEIANNTGETLYINCGRYNLLEKTKAGYALVDKDGDGFTYNGKNNFEAIGNKSKKQIRLYLGELIENGYARKGNYKIEIPIDGTSALTAEFEITDKTPNTETGISIICEQEYLIENNENFSYIIKNNSDERIQVTLAVGISQYKDGEWVRLPFSEKYYEIHYNASIWSEYLYPKSQCVQEFGLSLADMVDVKLTPGKYRIEKEIAFNQYFMEFDVH